MTEQELYAQYLAEKNDPKSVVTSAPSEEELYKQYLEEQNAPVVNEMHPGIDVMNRAIYKNFGADKDASFNFLKKKHPELQWKNDEKEGVLARKPGEKEWRKLDPDSPWYSPELQDISDVAYDIPAGIAQGTATAIGGLAGAGAGGIGALPAAMLASGGSGAVLESARQGLGSMMGIEDNFSGKDLAINTGVGLAAPLVFGTGATAKAALNMARSPVGQGAIKSAAKATFGNTTGNVAGEGSVTAAKELLKKQGGYGGKAYDKIAGYLGPKIGTVMSGENPETIKVAANMLDEIKAADTNPEIHTLPMQKAASETNKILKQKDTEMGKRMGAIREMIDNQPGIVLSQEGVAQTKGSIPTQSFLAPFEELFERLSKGGAGTEGQIADAKALREQVLREFKGLPENATAAQVDNLRQRFKAEAQKYGKNYANSGKAGGSNSGTAIDSQIANAFEQSRKNMSQAIIDRLEHLDPNLKAEYTGLNDSISKIKGLKDAVDSKTKNSKSMAQFLMRATKDPHEEQLMNELMQTTGLDLAELAHREQALRVFSKPTTTVRSLGGGTSTSRTIPLSTAGGATGYWLGQKLGFSPFISSQVGATMGALGGSPAMMRKYMEMNSLMRKLPAEIPPVGLPYLMMNPNLNDQGE